MPRVVYGVMTFHPTHDITVPDPALTVTSNVPNACNLCHLDRSTNWAIAEAKRLWPSRFENLQASTDDQFNFPEGPRMLFAGDALTRALAADALSGNGPYKPDPRWAGPLLVEGLADNYPIVRFFAADGLKRPGVPWQASKPDYLSAPTVREAALKQWRELMSLTSSDNAKEAQRLFQALMPRRRNVDLEVGE